MDFPLRAVVRLWYAGSMKTTTSDSTFVPAAGLERPPGDTKPLVSGALIPLACFVVVVAGMRAASAIVVPFLLAAFLSAICAPLVFQLRKRHVPSGLAVAIVMLVLLAAFVLTGYLVGTSVDEFASRLPSYQAALNDRMRAWVAAMGARGWAVREAVVTEYLNPGVLMRMIGNTVSGMASVLTNAVFILLAVVFMLAEAAVLPNKLRAVMKHPDDSLRRMSDFMDSFNRYLGIKTAISAVTGIAAWAWCRLLGVDFPVLWGLLAFLLNYVPNIGSIIAALPPVLLAVVQYGYPRALGVGFGYLVINMVFGNVVEPRWMGRELGLSTLVVFLSLVVWGWVLGPVGMLLSVPLTVVIKIALESYQDTRGIAILLGSGSLPGKRK